MSRAEPEHGSNARRNAVIAGVVVILLIIGAWYWIGRDPGAPTADMAMRRGTELISERGEDAGASMTTISPIAAPDTPVEGGATAPQLGGRVVDALSGAPISGASVAWVEKWFPEQLGGPGGYAFTQSGWRDSKQVYVVDLARQAKERGLEIEFVPPYREGAATVLRAEATTGDDGSFALPVRAAAHEYLRARAEGYAAATYGEPPAADADGVTLLHLYPAQIVRGRVVDKQGQPILGKPWFPGRVTLQIPCGGEPEWLLQCTIRPDAHGTFEFELGNASRIVLATLVMGYADLRREIALVPGVNDVTLTLEPGPHLACRVVDESGQPLPGATVMVREYKPSNPTKMWDQLSSHQSNDEGWCRTNLALDSFVDLAVSLDGYAPRSLEGLKLSDSPVEIVLEGEERGSISGVVLDPEREPVPGVEVRATLQGGGSINKYVSATGTTDENGEFRLDPLAAGTYLLRIGASADGRRLSPGATAQIAPGILQLCGTCVDVLVKAGEETRGLEIVLGAGAIIRGSITGTPEDIRHRFMSLIISSTSSGEPDYLGQISTDEAGRFEFRDVPMGALEVVLDAGPTSVLVHVSDASTYEVGFTLDAGSVFGRVSRDGKRVESAVIQLSKCGERIELPQPNMIFGGHFYYRNLPSGRYLILCRDRSDGAAMLRFIDVAETQLDLDLEWPTGTIAGRVGGSNWEADARIELDLVALDGVRLEGLVPAHSLRLLEVSPNNFGFFTLDGVAPGRYSITWTEGEAKSTEIEFDGSYLDVKEFPHEQ